MQRRIIITAITLSLLLGVALWSGGHDAQRQKTLCAAPISSAEALPNLQGEAALAHLKQRGIYQTIRRQLEAEHYRIRPLPAGGAPVGQAAYRADNHAQQLRADFAPDGLRLAAPTVAGPMAVADETHRLRLRRANPAGERRQTDGCRESN